MIRKYVLLGIAALAVVTSLMIVPLRQTYAQDGDCTSVDYTAIQQALIDAQKALDDGDVITAIQLQADAREALRSIFNDCSVKPMLEGMGVDQSTIDAVSEMPFCQYRFEATVRTGPDAGLNLAGTLALMQNSSASALGYVYPLDTTAAPVPVVVDLGEQHAVTLHFALSEDQSIVGTGYFTANIASCIGGIEGVFTGPNPDDVGDWIGMGCIMNPSSLNCTPRILIDNSNGQLPVLAPDPHFNPQQPPQQPENSPGICVPIRDAACVAACGNDLACKFACPAVGETCG